MTASGLIPRLLKPELLKWLMTDLITHESGDGATNLVITLLMSLRSYHDEEEARGHGYLGQVTQHHCLGQADETDDGHGEHG